MIVIVYGYRYLYLPQSQGSYALTALTILITLYLAYLFSHVVRFVVYRSYGRKREIGGKLSYGVTYQTRLYVILSNIFIGIACTITIINQLGFNSLLEAGGVIGFMGVMLGLTQGAWAPDIISGMIILNSDLIEEGDVVQIDAQDKIVGTVFKTKLFHTEILNLTNNHRIMIKNARLRDYTVHNLSKFASARGLRECISFNIAYQTDAAKVQKLFNDVFKRAVENKLPLEEQHCHEIKLLNTGDHAVEWGFIYYVKQVDKIVSLRRDLKEIALILSTEQGISLATPLTHEVQKTEAS